MTSKNKLNCLSSKDISLREKILEWYDKNGRHSLPWKNQSIYLIWISEIMLQQTQVKTVIPYFKKFKKKFPTLKKLIRADLDSILHSWSGLGYYRRAKNIYEACKMIDKEYKGIFPKSYEEILKLPGIGRTTAGAISTFSGLGSYSILDANVRRFLIRVYDLDIKESNIESILWKKSEELLCKKRSSDFIQAYMDIGSLICRKSNPKCSLCPANENCLGKKNIDNKLIIKPTKIKKSKLNLWTLVISDKQGKYYLEKISINKLWDGLYSSPIFLCQEDLETWARAHNLINQLDKRVRKFNHKLSHYDICFSVMSCNLDANKNISLLDDNWYNLSEINKGVPKFQFKAVESIS